MAQIPVPDLWTDGVLFSSGPVALRRLEEADCTDEYVSWLQDDTVNQYLETRWLAQSLESVRAFVREQRSRSDVLLLAILVEGDRHVGNIKVGPVNTRHDYGDLSYFLGAKDVWGRGLGSAAVRAACAVGFELLGLNRLQAGVYEQNTASIAVLEAAGFQHEGRFRQQLVGPHGREDHVWLGLLRTEWQTADPT